MTITDSSSIGLFQANKNGSSPLLDDRMQQLFTLDKQVGLYVFTDIQKAQKLLSELQKILGEFSHPDFELNYHISTALVENQLYNYTLSEIHFKNALEILNERGDASQLAEAYIDFAGTLLNLEEKDKAKYYLLEAGKFLHQFPDNRLQARLVCREGYLHLKNANHSKALQSFIEAEKQIANLEKSLDFKDYYFITLIKSGLGIIHGVNNEPEKSIQAYLQVVKLCETKGMRSRLSWHYLNVGGGYMSIQDDDNAIEYFTAAIKVIDDVNQQARAMAYANMGYCFYRKKLYGEALELLKKARPLFKDKREKYLANIEWWRAKVYKDLDKRKKSLKHYFAAWDFAKKAQDFKLISGILKDIATYHAEELKFKDAYDYQSLYDQAVEKYLSEVKDLQIKELEVMYEAERKEKEAEMFKLQATGLQLKALRAQMNPHFMFNALNSIQNYITSNETTSAAKYLAQFARLMRQSLDYSELEIISLEKEIEFLKNYLDINEKLRFENQLKYEIIVDEEIEEDIYGVPTMIIQPYIENAIEHGIRSRQNGLITVTFRLKDDETILCVIEDNGIGREKAKLHQENNPKFKNHKSLGTKITQERLEILLKSKNRQENVVSIIDLKDNMTNEALGTRVEILIPIVEIQMR
jgi:tetratricopeptide (TPR) repeat protein